MGCVHRPELDLVVDQHLGAGGRGPGGGQIALDSCRICPAARRAPAPVLANRLTGGGASGFLGW